MFLDAIKKLILGHPDLAPFAIAFALMIAGLNIPISADVVILIAATVAATLLKGSFFKIFLGIYFGSLIAAYLAYFQGRYLGDILKERTFFKKLFPQTRLEKIKNYYLNYSWATLIIGRFIPFGFRNALFISTGLSKFPFKAFAIRDAVACFIWSFAIYTSFYQLILSAQDVYTLIKKFNIVIFCVLGITVFGLVWYKQAKKQKLTT